VQGQSDTNLSRMINGVRTTVADGITSRVMGPFAMNDAGVTLYMPANNSNQLKPFDGTTTKTFPQNLRQPETQVAINQSGTVAFSQGILTLPLDTFVYTTPDAGQTVQTRYHTTGGQVINDIEMNESGTVAVIERSKAIFMSHSGTLQPVGGVANVTFTNIDLNNNDFLAYGFTNGINKKSIFIREPGGDFAALLEQGQSLFGSTLTDLGNDFSLNDANELAFSYTLANGRTGIGVIEAPEPAAGLLVVAAWTIAMGRRGRRHAC
jgi:hypothetical protein